MGRYIQEYSLEIHRNNRDIPQWLRRVPCFDWYQIWVSLSLALNTPPSPSSVDLNEIN
jgi:hypothetical protein